MVRLTQNKPYTVHARSIDRVFGTENDFKLNLRDPISCGDDHHIKATFVSCTMPSSAYQIDTNNNSFTVYFNDERHAAYMEFENLSFQSGADHTSQKKADGTSVVRRLDYQRQVDVTIDVGNYDIETLMIELTAKLNTACTAADTATRKFTTFFRGNSAGSGTTGPTWLEDVDDQQASSNWDGIVHTKDFIRSVPQFDWEHHPRLGKVRLFRTDQGGAMMLGQFTFEAHGPKLAMALGMAHVTAQQFEKAGLAGTKYSESASIHYRRLKDAGLPIYDSGWKVPEFEPGFGSTMNSQNCVNMFANDSVYVRCLNLPSNSYETLSGGQTNIMAVIPLYSGAGEDNFHSPDHPTSTIIGKMGITNIDVKLTDAHGRTLDLNGVEWEFQMLFEVFPNLRPHPTHQPPLAYDMPGAHAREPAPLPSAGRPAPVGYRR